MFNRWTVPIKGETVMSLDVTHKKTEKSYQRPSEDPEATSSMEDAIEKRTNNTAALTVTIYFK